MKNIHYKKKKHDHLVIEFDNKTKLIYNDVRRFGYIILKKKPLDIIDIDSLGIDTTPRIKTLKVIEPPKRKAGVMVSDVKELVKKLKYEAKVI